MFSEFTFNALKLSFKLEPNVTGSVKPIIIIYVVFRSFLGFATLTVYSLNLQFFHSDNLLSPIYDL